MAPRDLHLCETHLVLIFINATEVLVAERVAHVLRLVILDAFVARAGPTTASDGCREQQLANVVHVVSLITAARSTTLWPVLTEHLK